MAPRPSTSTSTATTAGKYAPSLVSSKGRYVWCEKAFRFAFTGKILRVTSAGNTIRHGQAGQTLRDAFRHLPCIRKRTVKLQSNEAMMEILIDHPPSDNNEDLTSRASQDEST